MGLVLVKHFIRAHHTSFVVFALNWELAAAFLLLKVEAHFWVLVDDTLHPKDERDRQRNVTRVVPQEILQNTSKGWVSILRIMHVGGNNQKGTKLYKQFLCFVCHTFAIVSSFFMVKIGIRNDQIRVTTVAITQRNVQYDISPIRDSPI